MSLSALSLSVAGAVAMVVPAAAASSAAGAPEPARTALRPEAGPTAGVSAALRQLRQEGGLRAVTHNGRTGTPSFLSLRSPLRSTPKRWLESHAALLGVPGEHAAVRQQRVVRGSHGGVHVRFQQTYRNVPVHGGLAIAHLDPTGRTLLAVSNGLVPGITLSATIPKVGMAAAIRTARQALPQARLTAAPQLVISAPGNVRVGAAKAILVWSVALDNGAGVSNTYFVDALRSGAIMYVENRIRTARQRSVYDLAHTTVLPGTLARREGQPPSGIGDVNSAYDATGAAYDYYKATFGRDSYDARGAPLVSSVRYGTTYRNAYWDGSRMVYGDGMASLDISGHELTHALTEKTASLDYFGQSGALNESLSDIFGEMIERYKTGATDWLMGKDSPVGVVRSLANPPAYGQPGTLANYYTKCDDNGGVHINSGIPNRAYYTIAGAVGMDKAQRIFYNALTTYLTSRATFKDARASTLAAASELYPGDSGAYAAVANGWRAVGVDGVTEPLEPDCAWGAAAAVASGAAQASGDAWGPAVARRFNGLVTGVVRVDAASDFLSGWLPPARAATPAS